MNETNSEERVPEEVILLHNDDNNNNNSLFEYGSLQHLVLCDHYDHNDDDHDSDDTDEDENENVNNSDDDDDGNDNDDNDNDDGDGDSDAGYAVEDIDWDVFIERTKSHPNEIDIDPLTGEKGYYPDLRESLLHFILRYHNPPLDVLEPLMKTWRDNQIDHHYYNYHNRISLLYIACIINQQSFDVIKFLLQHELDAIKHNCIISHNPLYFLAYDNSIDINVLQILLKVYPYGIKQDDGRDIFESNENCTSQTLCRDYTCTYEHRSNGYLPCIIDQRILCNCQRNFISNDITPISNTNWEKKFLYLKTYYIYNSSNRTQQEDTQEQASNEKNSQKKDALSSSLLTSVFNPVYVLLGRLFHENFITTVTLPLCQMSMYFSSYYDVCSDNNAHDEDDGDDDDNANNNNEGNKNDHNWFIIDFLHHISDNDPIQFTRKDDSTGLLPLHYLLQQQNHNHIPTFLKYNIIDILLSMYPESASIPYHYSIDEINNEKKEEEEEEEQQQQQQSQQQENEGRLPLHVCLENGWSLASSDIWRLIFDKAPQALQTRDVKSHLYPFQIATAAAAATTATTTATATATATSAIASSAKPKTKTTMKMTDKKSNKLTTTKRKEESTSKQQCKMVTTSTKNDVLLMSVNTTYGLLRRDPSILEQYISS